MTTMQSGQLARRTLGQTGIEVSRLALGGLFVSSQGGEFEQSRAAVSRAVELGVNYIDTAPTYGDSEAVLGRILPEVDPGSALVVSTKLGGWPEPFDPKNTEALRASFERSLERLGRDRIDLLMVHEPDRPGLYDWWDDFARVQGPVIDLLDVLREEGLVRGVGLGGTTVHEMAHLCASGKFDVVLTAFNYSLLWREAEHTVIRTAAEQGMGVIIGSPLQQGTLATRYQGIDDPAMYWLSPARRQQFRDLYALCDECGLSLPEMAIRFVVSNPAVSCVLTGARSAEEVQQNVAAVARGPLDRSLLDRLDEIASALPCRPAEEPWLLGWRLGYPGAYTGPAGVNG